MKSSDDPIRIGVSSCLLGNEVRFDGGHKRSRFVTDELAPFVEWVPWCPEVEAGLGTPRPAVRLVRHGDDVRVRETASDRDHTGALRRASSGRVRALRSAGLSGAIVKKDSPSCGMERVKLYVPEGQAERKGAGVFTAALMEAFPDLPVEEEGRLNDARLRENFIERVFAYHRLRALFRGRWTARRVVEFHTRHKLQLMAHSTELYRRLGRLVAEVGTADRAEFPARYASEFMQGLRRLATRGRNANVLNHAAGHLKKLVESESRQELARVIDDYREGLVPLVVPVTLIRHHVRRHGIEYLAGQTYLEPHPKELMLRNHV